MLWFEVLNASVAWTSVEALERWHVSMHGSTVGRRGDLAASLAGVDLLRSVFAARALGRPLAPAPAADLAKWLAAVTLAAAPGPERSPFAWPPLRAARGRSALPPGLEALLATALVQLAAAPEPLGVDRCRGVARQAGPPLWAPDDEAQFAAAAGLGALGANAGLAQCARLVRAPRGAVYCSKACSNAAFALRKAAREPRYFADKQRQYRARRQRPEPAAARSAAFLFVD